MKTIQVFFRLFHYVSQYRLKIIGLVIASLAGVVFEIAKPLPIKIVVDNVLGNQPLPAIMRQIFTGSGFLDDKPQLLFACIAFLIIITLGSALLSLAIFNFTISVAQRLVYDLSIDFFNKLQRLSLTFYKKNKIGDIMQRLTGDVFVVYFLVAQVLIPALTSVVCLAGMFYVMAKIDLVLALVAFTVVPLLGLTLAVFAKPMNDTTMEQYETQGHFSSFLQQSLLSMKIIQAFGRESFMNQKVKQHAQAVKSTYEVANKVSMAYNQISALITGAASALVVGFGAYRGLQGLLSAGDLFVFLGYITALNGPVNALSTAIGTTIIIGARGKRVFDVLDSDEVVIEKEQAVALTSPQGAVEFKNVTFGYGSPASASSVLNGINFKVCPGQIVAIVGQTGTGKTSLISLLSRFYDPWEGEVSIDGINVRELQLASLRENISLVLQDPFLFPMTIAENISFGNPDASFDEIVDAAIAAQAHDFILRLPDGYDTVLTETGASLSGGEKQRLSIARAFLKKAPILILDEPTSAVDALTEAKIFKALNQYAVGRTVFLISHRLSTLKHADQIITINKGYVAECGTHEDLIAADNLYAGLYKHQHIS